MEKAIWQGKTIYASDVKDKWEFEKSIKLLNKNGELKCPDPTCSSPDMIYCHGKIRRPYFAHKHTSDCDYDKYDKKNPQVINDIKRLIHNHLISKGFKADIDVKIFEHQYAHIVIYENGKPFAIELVQDSITTRRVNDLSLQYEKNNIPVKFLVVGDATVLQKESDANYVRRFSLNETPNNNLLVINEEGTELYQFRLDKYRYVYHGNKLYGYDEIYFEKSNLEELTFENSELTISGFSLRYNEWYTEKQERYKDFINEKNRIKIISPTPKIFVPQKMAKPYEEPQKTVDIDAAKKSKLKPVVLPPIDTSKVRQTQDLSFIEEIFLPPGKDTGDLFGIGAEEDFLKRIYRVCYRRDDTAFRHLIVKIKSATPAEEELYIRMGKEFKESRPDYHYILQTAYKKSRK